MTLRLPINQDFGDVDVSVCLGGIFRSVKVRARIVGAVELILANELEEDPWDDAHGVAGSLDPTPIEMDSATRSLMAARERGRTAVQDARRKRPAKKSRERGKA